MNELAELKSYKRSCELYLRALWGRGFSVQQTNDDEFNPSNNLIPLSYRINNEIYLPANLLLKKHYLHYYRAASLHAAAHEIYGAAAFEIKELNLMQRSMIGLIEDLRVELLAINSFPGLRKIWLSFHSLIEVYPDNAINLIRRLSRSVLDPHYEDTHLWVTKGKALLSNVDDLEQQSLSIDIGLSLANDLGQMRLPLNSGRYEQGIIYRDDNRGLWQEMIDKQQQTEVASQNQDSLTIRNKLKEAEQGIRLKLSHDNHKHGEGFYIKEHDQASFEYRQFVYKKIIALKLYPEWNYQKHLLQNDWCTVLEQQAEDGSESKINEIFAKHNIVRNRLRHIAKRLLTAKQQRVRKVEEGDEIDIDPMINAMVAVRMNQLPDPRVFMRNEYRRSKTLAISILLDLSESTNKTIDGGQQSISLMIRDAVLLLGETLSIADEQFSISGFCSNGRHEVYINHFKNFNESFEQSKARLSTVRGQYSTRLGAAIRNTADYLAQQSSKKKLLLVVTDGVPSDIDVFDRHYLDHDSWHAVHSLANQGIKPFCLNLDSRSDHVMEHIFGRGKYMTLDQLHHLPEILFQVYMRYGRH